MTQRKNERRGLGRGLSALMADIGVDAGVNDPVSEAPQQRAGLQNLPIEAIRANPDQPRRAFDERALEELSQSIREKGIVQPLVVRPVATEPGKFEIVAGERRWRAAQLARLGEVPVLIRAFSDQEVLEVAIIENIQREGLNAIEEAAGYRQLIDRFGHTQEKVAEALGKSRSHIANLLRLLTLPQDVQNMVVAGTISAGHARALVTAPDPVSLALKVAGEGLSVRETEDLARRIGHPASQKRGNSRQKDADTRVLEEDLSANLGMSVVIDHRAGGEGQVTIRYQTLDQLDQLCQLLSSVR
ncbi:MAG: ParB/RepB/Spo0J family partition protein [Rhodobacter sp.]|uniref:ParB/RepB/Spo0J family partition protein n=1 Tax=Pararhodobacter sp. TaxID=2127056 RepID=UPI001DED1CCA|nr:ParB/RepB/Spo0J family partition protein [Pararhodobacter sp.]MCB1344503.1 ParB/RepB/Spo0J family partition protein [Paracoccaceae bacterium]MCC0072344.1 ParB/RepB/Spo0J family partition protein [Rhodobacter sp.]HPD91520.1 ParB/RepB/Spo0J family partition protein [Pararhodobacter sp.]